MTQERPSECSKTHATRSSEYDDEHLRECLYMQAKRRGTGTS